MKTGARLGPYEIIEQLGAGGMGEVWLAEDSRLGRKVAIKVLPPEFAVDPERVARFEQEARAAAALNHPHIAAVFDIGEYDAGVRFIVQEYLQGQSLKAVLAAGTLPIKRALVLSTEIAEALAAAHAAGIIHRDIKPDNVFVTPDGHAKVLDFGLAKLTEVSVASNPNASMSPTLLGTIAGQVMGTAGYMSPEQVEGSTAIDHRADLFAFGTLLYEMACGERAFAGRSVADTLSRIQHEHPLPLGERDADLPAELQRIVSKLLAKDPTERYQHAADLIVDLRGLSGAVAAGTAPAMGESGGHSRNPAAVDAARPVTTADSKGAIGHPDRRAPTKMRGLVMALGALALTALGVWIGSQLPGDTSASAASEVHFAFELPPEVIELPRGYGTNISISPDGQTIAFIGWTANGDRYLYRRRMGAVGAERLGEMGNAMTPALAPDNEWVAYGVDQTRFLRLPLDGGQPFLLCDACMDGTWGDDGNFYFARGGAVWRMAPDGSNQELVLEPLPDQGVGFITRPDILPGSRAALVEIGNYERGGIAAISFDDKRVVHISEVGSDPMFSPTGHVLFPRDNSIFAVPFDAATLEIGGPSELVLSDVQVENGGAMQAYLAANGTLAYAPANGLPGTSLVLVSRAGEVETVFGDRRTYTSPRISPDGQRAAVIVNESGRTEIWLVDLEAQSMAQITTVGSATSPVWSLDGTQIVFGADQGEGFVILTVDIDSQAVSELHSSTYPLLPTAVMRDGSALLFMEQSPNKDLFALQLGDDVGTPSIEPIILSEEEEESATLSLDGRLLLYESESAGRREIFVRDLVTGREIQVSNSGGMEPAWSRDRDEVFFRDTSDYWLKSARITRDPELRVSDQETLFTTTPYWMGLIETAYDTAAGGKFLMVRQRDPGASPDRIQVILNFTDRLSR